MQAKFGARLSVKIHTLDSEAAKPYALRLKGSTTVFFDDEWVPLAIAIDKAQMEAFLSSKI
jgi:hypothetical protein